jgi:vesicle coat complex subunit
VAEAVAKAKALVVGKLAGGTPTRAARVSKAQQEQCAGNDAYDGWYNSDDEDLALSEPGTENKDEAMAQSRVRAAQEDQEERASKTRRQQQHQQPG